MSASTQPGTVEAKTGPMPVKMGFEVAVLPVADVDRSKAFYLSLGWRLDADFPIDEHFRIVQFTPPGSATSIQFGVGLTAMIPGTVDGLYLIVDDIEAARADLISRGARVSAVWHGRGLGTEGHLPGPDPDRKSYGTFASFTDPDGNRWLLQEVSERLPGRGGATLGAETIGRLLHETAEHHDPFEKSSQPHDWWDWYGAYLGARLQGSTSQDASAEAGRYMAEVKHVLPR